MSKLTPLNKCLYSALPLYKDDSNRLCIKTKISIKNVFEFIKFNLDSNTLIKFITNIDSISSNQHGLVIKFKNLI